jgi:hypothetical protein
VDVRWHGVPHVSWLKQRHTHHNLAALYTLRIDIFVYGSLITIQSIPQVDRRRSVNPQLDCGVGGMSWGTKEEELGWCVHGCTAKNNLTSAFAYIKGISLGQSV